MPKKDGVKSTSNNGRGKLTDKQKRFVEEYLVDLNATQAAIRAGYSANRASEISYQLLQKTTVQNAIQNAQNQRSNRTQVTQDKIIENLLYIVQTSSGQKQIVLSEIRTGENGEKVADDVAQFVFEPHATNKALELLGKHLGMFKDKVDLTNSDGSFMPTVIELVAPSLEKDKQ
ncbi:terminase small subunit [Lonepinella sp. BR2930]|uniref:terminase small subunit n=1 Tax=Lonepinella sp. BR2930 TaxID=3434554 RepID=UPI003F6DF61A